MLQLSKKFINQPLLSLRTGGAIGIALEPLINPDNLKIEGWICKDHNHKGQMILVSTEVRDIISRGIVVDDNEALSPPAELVRLQRVLELRFELLGKQVFSTSKKRVGKVSDYAAEMQTFFINKLYVTQPLLKTFTSNNLVIDRSQIVEITNRKIVVQEPTVSVKEGATVTAPAIPG